MCIIFCAHLIIILGVLNLNIITSTPPLECLHCIVCVWSVSQTDFIPLYSNFAQWLFRHWRCAPTTQFQSRVCMVLFHIKSLLKRAYVLNLLPLCMFSPWFEWILPFQITVNLEIRTFKTFLYKCLQSLFIPVLMFKTVKTLFMKVPMVKSLCYLNFQIIHTLLSKESFWRFQVD